MLRRLTLACLFGSLLLVRAGSAHAYDLSRMDSPSEDFERGFVVGQAGLWVPGLDTFEKWHELSLDFAGEVGFRVASLRGMNNIYVVAGASYSPQKLNPELAGRYRDSALLLFWGGVRYLPGAACFGDGLGCPFIELRVGPVFEFVDDRAHHTGAPDGNIMVLPGVGYRFLFGRAFQLGVRADVAFGTEDEDTTLGWVSLAGFLGVSW